MQFVEICAYILFKYFEQDGFFCGAQVTHKAQYEAKRQVLQENNNVDDIYDMLAIYDQKVPTTDQARFLYLRFLIQIRVG